MTLSQYEIENRLLQLEGAFQRLASLGGRIVSPQEPERPFTGMQWFDLQNNSEKTWDGSSWVSGGVRAKVGTFSISATGSLSVTGVGFKPKAVVIMASNGASTPRILQSTGYTDGINMNVQYIWQDTAPPNYVSQLDTNVTGNLIVHLEGAAGFIRADFDGFTNDGFTLDVISNTLSGSSYGYIAFG